MAGKAILVLCAQALLIQCTLGQCLGRAPFASGIAAPYGFAGRSCGYDRFGHDRFGYDGFGYDGFGYDGFGYDGFGYDGFGYDRFGYGGAYGLGGFNGFYDFPSRGLDITSTSGGSLVVTSSSAIPPVGISIVSDNAYEGILAVAGEAPFIGTTGMEGALPTIGAGAINYGCGDGITAMVSDVTSPIGPVFPGIYPGYSQSVGCGCNLGIL